MQSTLGVREISAAAVAEAPERRVWANEAPRSERTAGLEDGLRPARGIFTAVVLGAAVWAVLGWGALILVDRIWS